MNHVDPTEYAPETFRTWLRSSVDSLEPGSACAPDSAIAAHWGISSRTVRRAMQALADEGLVVRIQGKGTFRAGAVPPDARPEPGVRESASDSLASSLHDAIREGALKRGDALPKLRYVSVKHRVSERTITRAYRRLESMGLVRKVGKRYWVGGFDIRDSVETRNEAWLVADSPGRLNTTFTRHLFAPAYRRFEEELIGCGIALRCFTIDELHEQVHEAASAHRRPVGIAFTARSSEYLEKALSVVARRFGDTRRTGIRILAEVLHISQFTRRPPGINVFARGHLHTAQARALADHVCARIRRDVVIIRDWPRSSELGRAYIRMNKIAYAIAGHRGAPRRVAQAFINPEVTREDRELVLRTLRENAAHHEYLLSEFGAGGDGTPSPTDAHIYRDMAQLCAALDGNAVWLCESSALAVAAQQTLAAQGRAVPGDIALVSLESAPELLAHGISSCAPDLSMLGYLMAHALIGDFELKRTSHGFIRVPGRVVERFTTP